MLIKALLSSRWFRLQYKAFNYREKDGIPVTENALTNILCLNEWLKDNKLKLNKRKTKITFSIPGDTALFIGVTLDNRLSWKNHID